MDKPAHTPLTTLEVLRRNKQIFHNKLCQASKAQNALHLQKLRSENAFVLAEFMFLFQTFDLAQFPDRFSGYVHIHNTQLRDLIDNPDKRKLMGLEVPRLKKGLFSDSQIAKAIANLQSQYGGLDQADMQRLTIMLFSPETGRRMIEILEDSGFLERIKTPYMSMIVISNGFVEECFGAYLNDIKQNFSESLAP